MGRLSKQKSCFACVETKRRCDKRLPSCSRCLDRGVACGYPLVPPNHRLLRSNQAGSNVTPDINSSNVWISSSFNYDASSTTQIGEAPTLGLLGPTLDTSLIFQPSLSSFSSLLAPLSGIMDNPASSQPTPKCGDIGWFLQPQAWTVAFHYQPPSTIPKASIFSNFIRGLQDWLFRFVRNGHNPFIHRHLYSESGYPQCIQDAYSAIAISKNATSNNEEIVGAISSTHISNLLDCQPVNPTSFNMLSTRDHLARTQSLLIHILLALFSSSIQRRAKAENLISTLHMWNNQLWESAIQDLASLSPLLNATSASAGVNAGDNDPISSLYRAFVLSESTRRTWLLCNLATGVYNSLKGEFTETCGGDIPITMNAEFWEAQSSPRWEAIVRHTDPLFIYSLHGQTLLDRGVSASQVDEFARHLFTVMWGIEKVESWVIRTGDAISVEY